MAERPAHRRPRGVQGERRPPQHHQPDDWAKIAGKRGTDRLTSSRSWARRRKKLRSVDARRQHGPVSVRKRGTPARPYRSVGNGGRQTAPPFPPRVPNDRGAVFQGTAMRSRKSWASSRVRDHGQESARLQPISPRSSASTRTKPSGPHGSAGTTRPRAPARCAGVRVHGGEGRHLEGRGRGFINLIPVERRAVLRRSRASRVLEPETTNPRDLVIWIAGRKNLNLSRQRAESRVAARQRILIYKNNTDSKGNSYGTHENYLMDRRVPFARTCRHMMPSSVSRRSSPAPARSAPRNNAGRVRLPDLAARRLPRDRGGPRGTMHSRPIINTRDEPHAVSGEVPPAPRHRRRRQP